MNNKAYLCFLSLRLSFSLALFFSPLLWPQMEMRKKSLALIFSSCALLLQREKEIMIVRSNIAHRKTPHRNYAYNIHTSHNIYG